MSAFLSLLLCAEDQQAAVSTILPGSTRRGPNPLKTWLKGDWSCSLLRGTEAAPCSVGLKLLLAQWDWSCSLVRGTEAAPCSEGLKLLFAQGDWSCSLLGDWSCSLHKKTELLLAKVSLKLLVSFQGWLMLTSKGEVASRPMVKEGWQRMSFPSSCSRKTEAAPNGGSSCSLF